LFSGFYFKPTFNKPLQLQKTRESTGFHTFLNQYLTQKQRKQNHGVSEKLVSSNGTNKKSNYIKTPGQLLRYKKASDILKKHTYTQTYKHTHTQNKH